MSMEDAKKFYEHAAGDKAVRDEIVSHWDNIHKIAEKHGYSFTHAEYYDFIHAHTGMTNVGPSHEQDETDTCITVILSETPRY